VEQGYYVVVQIQPANYEDVHDYDESTGPGDPDGDDSAQGPDNDIPVELLPGEADLDNNFLEDADVGFITGEVREDTGQPVVGVTINLYADLSGDGIPNDGSPFATTITDALGAYAFVDLEHGMYVLEQIHPIGYLSISDVDGSVDINDPDGDDGPVPNEWIPVVLAPGETDADNDFVEFAYPGIIC